MTKSKKLPKLFGRAKPLSTLAACRKHIKRLQRELEYTKQCLANARDDAQYWHAMELADRLGWTVDVIDRVNPDKGWPDFFEK